MPAPPRSSYYTGPPPKGSAFGTAPSAIVGKHQPREMVRVERDYSLSPSHIPQFYPSFPLELETRISPTDFTELINDINTLLIAANDMKWAALDNSMAVLTLWISPWLLGSHYQRRMNELTDLIEEANEKLLNPKGLQLLHPQKTAWLFLEIEYY
ncbi:unnamed protein product [Parajaminaea phylloscopi]